MKRHSIAHFKAPKCFAWTSCSDVKLRSIDVKSPCCEVVAVDANRDGRSTSKDLHVGLIDVSRSETLTVAAELAQIHDVEPTDLGTCSDDVFGLIDILLRASASEHILVNTYIEAPNVDVCCLYPVLCTRCPRHCERLSLLALECESPLTQPPELEPTESVKDSCCCSCCCYCCL